MGDLIGTFDERMTAIEGRYNEPKAVKPSPATPKLDEQQTPLSTAEAIDDDTLLDLVNTRLAASGDFKQKLLNMIQAHSEMVNKEN